MKSWCRIWSSMLAVFFCCLSVLLCDDPIQSETSPRPASAKDSEISPVSDNLNDFTTFQFDRIAAQESYFFIKRIFERYGDQDKMTLHSLTHFFEKLGLLSAEESHGHKHRRDVSNKLTVAKLSSDVPTSTFPVPTSSDVLANGTPSAHFHDMHTQCLTPKELLGAFDFPDTDDITKQHFLYLSPAVLFQFAFCDKKRHSHDHHHQETHDYDLKAIQSLSLDKTHFHVHTEHNHVHNDSDVAKHRIPVLSTSKVWGYSTIAVVIISLAGLLGVAAIPLMQKIFYNHLLQFLVALAVGALTGDALLHLLPHSMNEHNHADEDNGEEDHSAVFKGLLALSGMFLFFFVERLLTIFTDYKRRRRQKKKNKELFKNESLLPKDTLLSKDDSKIQAVGAKLSNDPDYTSCEEMMMVVHSSKVIKEYADDTRTDLQAIEECTENNHTDVVSDDETIPNHSHHGHSHSVPNSVAAVAWMVILGDGIHNFSDGLAIGAAFADSLPGGFSTAIAVFCHELPHEIGDFAVLLRAGMSVKQAIVYNCVSSVLCFIGMLIGVALGNIANMSLWIFVIVAGMFLYVALVDMLPEIMSVRAKKGENQFSHLIIQCIGMMIGAGIMLTIALHEKALLSLLGLRSQIEAESSDEHPSTPRCHNLTQCTAQAGLERLSICTP